MFINLQARAPNLAFLLVVENHTSKPDIAETISLFPPYGNFSLFPPKAKARRPLLSA